MPKKLDRSSSVPYFLRQCYQFMYGISLLARYHPAYAIMGFLALQIMLVAGREQSDAVSFAKYNQSPFLPADAFLFNNTCHPAEILHDKYHVFANVALHEVKYFLFLESHNNLTHHAYKGSAIAAITSPSDVLLFESVDAGDAVYCSSVGYMKDGTQVFTRTNHPNPRPFRSSQPDVVQYHFSDTLHCAGWDNLTIIGLHKKKYVKVNQAAEALFHLYEAFNKIGLEDIQALKSSIGSESFDEYCNKLFHFLDQFRGIVTDPIYQKYISQGIKKDLDNIAILNGNFNKFKEHKDYYGATSHPKFAKDYTLMLDHLYSAMNGSYHRVISVLTDYQAKNKKHEESIIINRNKSGMSALFFFKDDAAIKVGFFGQSHFIKQKSADLSESFYALEKEDPSFELRKGIEKLPHAILLPK